MAQGGLLALLAFVVQGSLQPHLLCLLGTLPAPHLCLPPLPQPPLINNRSCCTRVWKLVFEPLGGPEGISCCKGPEVRGLDLPPRRQPLKVMLLTAPWLPSQPGQFLGRPPGGDVAAAQLGCVPVGGTGEVCPSGSAEGPTEKGSLTSPTVNPELSEPVPAGGTAEPSVCGGSTGLLTASCPRHRHGLGLQSGGECSLQSSRPPGLPYCPPAPIPWSGAASEPV